jgi:hypothetical protein
MDILSKTFPYIGGLITGSAILYWTYKSNKLDNADTSLKNNYLYYTFTFLFTFVITTLILHLMKYIAVNGIDKLTGGVGHMIQNTVQNESIITDFNEFINPNNLVYPTL